MSPLRVAVTGARGYAGSYIATAIERRGHEVVELVRRPVDSAPRAQIAFDMSRGVQPAVLRQAGVNALVHAAWDFRPPRLDEIRRGNAEGPARPFDAFEAGDGTDVIISTIAAFDGCKSQYQETRST